MADNMYGFGATAKMPDGSDEWRGAMPESYRKYPAGNFNPQNMYGFGSNAMLPTTDTGTVNGLPSSLARILGTYSNRTSGKNVPGNSMAADGNYGNNPLISNGGDTGDYGQNPIARFLSMIMPGLSGLLGGRMGSSGGGRLGGNWNADAPPMISGLNGADGNRTTPMATSNTSPYGSLQPGQFGYGYQDPAYLKRIKDAANRGEDISIYAAPA